MKKFIITGNIMGTYVERNDNNQYTTTLSIYDTNLHEPTEYINEKNNDVFIDEYRMSFDNLDRHIYDNIHIGSAVCISGYVLDDYLRVSDYTLSLDHIINYHIWHINSNRPKKKYTCITTMFSLCNVVNYNWNPRK